MTKVVTIQRDTAVSVSVLVYCALLLTAPNGPAPCVKAATPAAGTRRGPNIRMRPEKRTHAASRASSRAKDAWTGAVLRSGPSGPGRTGAMPYVTDGLQVRVGSFCDGKQFFA